MLQVHVLSHKDGDKLAIVRVPWWMPIYEFIWHRFCPCCGVMSQLSRFEWLGNVIYGLSNRTSRVMLKFEPEVYSVPIANSCEASSKLYGSDNLCWKDDCEYHVSGDAYEERRRHVIVNWMVQFADWCKLTCLKPIRLLRGKLGFGKTHR